MDGKRFVTARGWDDLSQMIHLYEQHKIPVDQKLVEQYIQNPEIAQDCAIYYDLYKKYKSDYQIKDILAGTAPIFRSVPKEQSLMSVFLWWDCCWML